VVVTDRDSEFVGMRDVARHESQCSQRNHDFVFGSIGKSTQHLLRSDTSLKQCLDSLNVESMGSKLLEVLENRTSPHQSSASCQSLSDVAAGVRCKYLLQLILDMLQACWNAKATATATIVIVAIRMRERVWHGWVSEREMG
jgi:hypothetical protein